MIAQRIPVLSGRDQATITLLAAMEAAGAPASGERAVLIDQTIRALKGDGAWDRLDGFYMPAAHAAAAARINWKAPGTFNLTAVNSPTFTVDQGYAGDGVSAYLETGFNPATASGNFTQDSSHAGIVIQDAQGAASDAVFGNEDNIISPWRTGPAMLIRSSSTSNNSVTISGAQGVHKGFSRTGAAGHTPYEDGVALSAVTQASAALASRNFMLLARNSATGAQTPTARRLFAAHFGGGLTAAQMLSIRNAIATYRTALGT